MFPISKFDWNGFACPIPVMKPFEAAALADQILRFQHEEPEKAARAFGTNTHLLFPSLCAVIQREQILDAVEQVLGRKNGSKLVPWTGKSKVTLVFSEVKTS